MTKDDARAKDAAGARTTGVRKAVRITPREMRAVNEQLVLSGVRADETIEDLRTVAEFRERLLGIVGHDLRSPLNAITMASSLLLAGRNLRPEDTELVQRISASSRRMARMITQILEFTRARLGGGFELDVSDANLGDLVHAVAAELRLGASAHIDVRTEGNLVGRWDADRLSQAISNVMGNAVDHATPDTAIVVDVHDEKDTLVLAIANEGKPIPPELLPVIFEPFRHGATDAREAGHMGLGLYIAREMGASHGGTLDVESSSGVTTFTFRLPRYPS